MRRSRLLIVLFSYFGLAAYFLFVRSSVASADIGSERAYLESDKVQLASASNNGSPPYVSLKHQFDVRKYTLDVKPNLTSGKIKATTSIKIRSKEKGLKNIELNFVGDWKIKKVLVDGKTAKWEHDGVVLTIKLGKKADKGEYREVTVSYKGIPKQDPEFDLQIPTFWVKDGIYGHTHFEPFQARYFFPCFDEPSEKAEEGCEVIVTVPKDLTAVANGVLVTTKDKGKNKVFHYAHEYPIATYLIAFAIAPYEIINDKYKKIPVVHYVFAENKESVELDFGRVPRMMRYFSKFLGPYPFEKYGAAMINSNLGTMENQTISFTIPRTELGQREYECIVVHGLAHSWLGNAVTISDFHDKWLKDGLASYCEALWLERAEGIDARDERLTQFNYQYFHYEGIRITKGIEAQPLRSQDYITEHWCTWLVTHAKAAAVFHTLRWEMGDDNFFSSLKKLYSDNLYGYIDTTKLKNTMESISGKDLSDFFQSWIYSPGHPEFIISSSYKTVDDRLKSVITVEQVQGFTTTFPVTLLIDPDGDGATAAQRMFVSGRSTSFEVDVPAQAGAARIIDIPWLLMRDYTDWDYSD